PVAELIKLEREMEQLANGMADAALDEKQMEQTLNRYQACKIRDLSGGERMRLRLAQLMHRDVNALILDEPTNHLDIDSREVLEEALRDFRGTILAVSHDRYFLNQLFAPVYWLENGTLTRFEGNYDEARRKRAER